MVIIGGASGMGVAILDRGASVLVTDRSKEGLESAQKEMITRVSVIRMFLIPICIDATTALSLAVGRSLRG